MRHLVLTLTGALTIIACGSMDDMTTAEEEAWATAGEESSATPAEDGATAGEEDAATAEEENTATVSQALVNVWTPYVSDEAGHNMASCGSDANVGATRARCQGRYCDNMYLYCGTLPPGFSSTATGAVWTSTYVSEEQPAGLMCPNTPSGGRMIVDGIRARGSYADDVSLRCRPATLPPDSQMNCGWTPWFSEEQNIQEFRYNVFSYQTAVARGVRCSGRYCDSMSYYVCEPKCTSNSQCFGGCSNGVCAPS